MPAREQRPAGLAGQRGLTAPHTAPRPIAAWDGVDGLEPPRTAGGGRDLAGLTAALNAPLLAAGLRRQDWADARPVYHLAVSADRYDRGTRPVYFGGGKLAADLTVPRLQARWQHPDTQPAAVSGSGTAPGSQPARGSSTDADRAGHGRPDRFGLTPAERARDVEAPRRRPRRPPPRASPTPPAATAPRPRTRPGPPVTCWPRPAGSSRAVAADR